MVHNKFNTIKSRFLIANVKNCPLKIFWICNSENRVSTRSKFVYRIVLQYSQTVKRLNLLNKLLELLFTNLRIQCMENDSKILKFGKNTPQGQVFCIIRKLVLFLVTDFRFLQV